MSVITALGTEWLRAAFLLSFTAAALGTVAVATERAAPVDGWLLERIGPRASATPGAKPTRLATAARDLTALGGDTLRILFLLGIMIALASDGRWRLAGCIAAIVALARLFLFVLKAIVRRRRPPSDGERIATYTSSFPSGHTFMAGVLYLAAAILIPTGMPASLTAAAIGSALMLSLAIGVTRIAFGIHWPSDVAVGWLAAIAWTSGCVLGLLRFGLLA